MELSEFDIDYLARPAIKEQDLDDFIVEYTISDEERMLDLECPKVITEQAIEKDTDLRKVH